MNRASGENCEFYKSISIWSQCGDGRDGRLYGSDSVFAPAAACGLCRTRDDHHRGIHPDRRHGAVSTAAPPGL